MPEHTPAPTPHRAIYGFFFFVLFLMLFTFYLCWALMPDSVLADRLGLTYMPDKYFAMFVPPVIAFALTLFGFVVYPAMNLAGTFEPTDERTVRDEASIRRCTWPVRSQTGVQRRCDRRVEHRVADGWWTADRCDRHAAKGGDPDQDGEASEDDIRIDNFCDCSVGDGRCVLRQRPDHVRCLLDRLTVPSVCDLDVSEVSALLFGRRE